MKLLIVSMVVVAGLLYFLLSQLSPARAGLGSTIPKQTHEIEIGANQHGFQPSHIRVKSGKAVRIVVTDEDVSHGLTIPDLNLTALRTTARKAVLEFTPQQPGTYTFRCNIQCGLDHDRMVGTLVVE